MVTYNNVSTLSALFAEVEQAIMDAEDQEKRLRNGNRSQKPLNSDDSRTVNKNVAEKDIPGNKNNDDKGATKKTKSSLCGQSAPDLLSQILETKRKQTHKPLTSTPEGVYTTDANMRPFSTYG